MTSKEKFLVIKNNIICKSRSYKLGTTYYQMQEPYEKFELNDALDEIEKNLGIIEKLEQVIEILKPFLKDRIMKYDGYFGEWYGLEDDEGQCMFCLEKDQYELLKEVFDDDNN